MITILVLYERISLFHTMEPFFLKNRNGKKRFRFTQSVDWCLKHDTNTILFMERCFEHREPRNLSAGELEIMKKLRDKYRTIVFFCGQPEAGTNRLDLLPYTDRLFYKSVFKDRNNYRKKLYGKNLFADYYHKCFGINDDPEYLSEGGVSVSDAERPELSWNIGIGSYPRLNWPQRAGTVLARLGMPRLGRFTGRLFRKALPPAGSRRDIAVHARIDPVTCPSIAYQRKLFLERIAASKQKALFLTGMTSQNRYYRELRESKMVLSPFGWGEVCFRDFEAVLSGALLLKPDMSHLLTWPDIYIPYETYVPLRWDGSDLDEKCRQYLEDEKERNRIASNAFEHYRKALAELPGRLDSVLGGLL